MWWCILVLGMQSQEEHKFKVSLGYTAQLEQPVRLLSQNSKQTTAKNIESISCLISIFETRADYDITFCNLDVFA